MSNTSSQGMLKNRLLLHLYIVSIINNLFVPNARLTILLFILGVFPLLAPADLPPSEGGAWEGSPFPLEIPVPTQQKPYHAVLIPSGKVLLFRDGTEKQYDPRLTNGISYPPHHVREFNPVTNGFEIVGSVPTPESQSGNHSGCGGTSHLKNGKVFLTGGRKICPSAYTGICGGNWAFTYDSNTKLWTRVADMPGTSNSPGGGRWYPTNVTLGDGRVLVASGKNETGGINTGMVIYDPNLNRWSVLKDSAPRLALYPFMHVLPTGKVLAIDLFPESLLGEKRSYLVDPNNPLFLEFLSPLNILQREGAVDFFKTDINNKWSVLVTAGGEDSNPTNISEIINSQITNWQFDSRYNLRIGRHHPNSVMLPDGMDLVIGGVRHVRESGDTDEPIHDPELFDPGNPSLGWKLLNRPPSQIERGYHSMALLLPDARVMLAGGDNNLAKTSENEDGKKIDIFKPPYFFKRAPLHQPQFTLTNETVQLGSTLEIQTTLPAGKSISRVALINLPAVTHSRDMGQRRIKMNFSVGTTANSLMVSFPSNTSLIPPGYYLLFIVDTDGVPSVGKIIKVRKEL